MSNPTLPPAASLVPPMAAAAISPSSFKRRARDPDDDDADALEEGELRLRVPDTIGHESSDSDTEDDRDAGRRYHLQPRVEYDDDHDHEVVVRRPQHHGSPRPRRHRPLNALDILLLGPGAALPSPTTPSGECDSEGTLSDDDHHHGSLGVVGGNNPTGGSGSSEGHSSSAAAADAVDRGSAATGKRGWKGGAGGGGNNKDKKPAAVVLAPPPTTPAVSDLNTVSAATGGGQGGTSSPGAQQAAHHHQQTPLQAPPPPRRVRARATEYTCKECGKSYTTNQALGGHAAGHKTKQREAAAMEAAMAAAAAAGDVSGASLAAAFPLIRGGGKADEPHECRKCGKVFASGVALGGHMRVHYTGPPIAPARKNKKRCLAPPPPPPTTPAEGDIAFAAAPPPVGVGLSLALPIKAEEEESSSTTTPPAVVPVGGAVRSAVRLFGFDIYPQAQPGSGDTTTTEDSSSTPVRSNIRLSNHSISAKDFVWGLSRFLRKV